MSHFEMELRTTPSHHNIEGPMFYQRVLAVGTPHGLVECDYIDAITTPIDTTLYDVPPTLARDLGEVFERYVAHFNPEAELVPEDAPEYWCHNITELRTGYELDRHAAARFVHNLAPSYQPISYHEAQPAGTHIVVREPKARSVSHSFVSLGEPPEGAYPQGISFFDLRGNLGVASYEIHFFAYDNPDYAMELAAPPANWLAQGY
ncbi:MAG TPA: hypothetical protein VJP80_06040 [Candidatus Saccharimonadales bacterium]|nr:hypothetical protein [Candidatus Saccharimonadales bacterium]